MFYFRVLRTFLNNALSREMSFRGNFIIGTLTRAFWFSAQLTLFGIIFSKVPEINGWSRYQFYVFLATGMMINTLIEAFFMPNCANFSELIRTGELDFVLLKPIDTQFIVSLEKIDLGTLSHLILSGSLLVYSVSHLGVAVTPFMVLAYVGMLFLSVAFFYSLMLILAATSVFFGRNQGLYDFWFYITIFSRYPREIYLGSLAGDVLYFTFSSLIPVLLVVNLPAQVLAGKLFEPGWIWVWMMLATVVVLVLSRRIFLWSVDNYRSAGG